MKFKGIAFFIFIFFFFVSCSKKEQTQPQDKQDLSSSIGTDVKEENGQIHIAHILVMHKNSQRRPASITRTKEEAKAQAEKLLQKLHEGSDFGQLAGLYSDCPSKKVGGDLGFIKKGDMVKDFESAAFTLQKGQLSTIVETQFGYHIIKRF